jgi:hypothetical protein
VYTPFITGKALPNKKQKKFNSRGTFYKDHKLS